MSTNGMTGNSFTFIPAENIGTFDQWLRYAIAALLVGHIVFTNQVAEWQLYLVLLSIPLTATALVRWDPVYQVLNIDTRYIDNRVFDAWHALRRWFNSPGSAGTAMEQPAVIQAHPARQRPRKREESGKKRNDGPSVGKAA